MKEENKPKTEENQIKTKEDVKEIKEKEYKPQKNISKSKETLTDKMRENPWIISTLVLGVLVLVLLVGNFSGDMTGKTISEAEAGEAILNFVQSRTQGQGELIELNNFDNNFYEAVVSFQGQEIPLYITKDGKNLVQGVMPFEEIEKTDSQQTQQTLEYSEEDNQKIQEFSQCLADKGLRVYYAEWCGHCHALIETFGGEQNIGEGFIKCSDANRQPTEYAELCNQEEIQGFPTIKINSEIYQGARTFEAFSEATGCPVPELSI